MTAPLKRTAAHEDTLFRMAREGASDRTIAAELHVDADTIRRWRRALGLPRYGRAAPIEREPTRDRDAMPLPAGSPVTWGAISAGQPWPEQRA